MSNKIEASGIELPHRPYVRARSQALPRGLGAGPRFSSSLRRRVPWVSLSEHDESSAAFGADLKKE